MSEPTSVGEHENQAACRDCGAPPEYFTGDAFFCPKCAPADALPLRPEHGYGD